MTRIIKIEGSFERSSERRLSAAQPEPDPNLIAEGWDRRFTADARRAEEAVELYGQLGYEVRTETVRPEELTGECEGCRSPVILEFKTIYTRKRTG
jgi:hypothetical protein